MRLGDFLKWQPPGHPMEQVRGITEWRDELVIVTTDWVYRVKDDPQTEFRVTRVLHRL